MALYSVAYTNITNADGTNIVYAVLPITPTTRLRWPEIIIGSRAAPQDYACNYEWTRVTNEGATPGGTVVTPDPVDEGDPAAASNAVAGATGAPTYGAISLQIPVNMRATYRWLAQPGREFVTAATEDYGYGLVSDTPSTAFNVTGTIFFEE